MFRVVLSVLLAAALLGASMAAIESVRVTHAETQVGDALDELERAAASLAAENDPPPAGEPGPMRQLRLSLPTASWDTAPVDRVRLSNGSPTAVRWQVVGGDETVRQLSESSLVIPGDGELVLGAGRHRLRLELTAADRVVVERQYNRRDTTREETT